ncbi:MAG: sigma-54 dependent transcriptional regulator [Candidatus Margulisiibacteriota bacterium]
MEARDFIVNSRAMRKVLQWVKRIAGTSYSVLITGETGTGKELVARLIQELSPRSHAPFLKVSIPGLSETLIESELFGHVKGAFTGASTERKGLFEAANEGTLFLDEIGDISSAVQTKLLRVLQEKEIQPVGSNCTRKVDTRVIPATNCDFSEMIKEGGFRKDLFYRFQAQIRVPPLRERLDDILPLAKMFLEKCSVELGIDAPQISYDAQLFLLKRQWPGNVREVERLIIDTLGAINKNTKELKVKHFKQAICQNNGSNEVEFGYMALGSIMESLEKGESIDLPSIMEELQKAFIESALSLAGGVKSEAARILGLSRTTLIEKIKALYIEDEEH